MRLFSSNFSQSFCVALLLLLVVVSCQELPVEPEPIDLSASKPIALNDSLRIFEDDSTLFVVLLNDSVANMSALRLDQIVSMPPNGTTRIEGDQLFYRPNNDFFGMDSLHYSVTAGFLPDTATVIIEVLGTADNPIAVNDTLTVDEDSEASAFQINTVRVIDVLANDMDPDQEPIIIVSLTPPNNGTASIKGAGTSISYTPSPNFSGSDRFSYVINDPTNRTAAADVIITVSGINDVPIAIGNGYEVQENTPLTVLAPGILFNDQDADNDDILEAILVTDVANGSLSLDADGGFVYTPRSNFFGQDRFTYRASDGTATSNVATVLLNVSNGNSAPVAVEDQFTLNEDEEFQASTSVLDNDSDPDGDNIFAVFVDDVSNGQLSFGAAGGFIYTPDQDFFGEDSFTYHASDGTANSTDVKVTLIVQNVNDLPEARDDSYDATSGSNLDVDAPGVLSNDVDIDGDDLIVTRVMDTSRGTLILRGDGSFRYTPNIGFTGIDTFTYLARDGSGSSEEATVNISVAGNAAPVAVTDSFTVAVNQTLAPNAPGVLGNDTDANGDNLVAILAVAPSNGTLILNSDGSFSYTPDTDFTGEDKFRYQASDGQLNSAGVEVVIDVQ